MIMMMIVSLSNWLAIRGEVHHQPHDGEKDGRRTSCGHDTDARQTSCGHDTVARNG